jgi:hypothetical protein
MKDMQVHLEKLRTDAAECGLITDPTKRELFTHGSQLISKLLQSTWIEP